MRKERRIYLCAPKPCAECERLRAQLKTYEDAAFDRPDAFAAGAISAPAGSSSGARTELERGELGGSSGPFGRAAPAMLPAMPPHPPDDGAARPKWNSKWDFDRAGERVRIVVVAIGPTGKEETIDAREFIERLGENHEGTMFAIHVETEQIEREPNRLQKGKTEP